MVDLQLRVQCHALDGFLQRRQAGRLDSELPPPEKGVEPGPVACGSPLPVIIEICTSVQNIANHKVANASNLLSIRYAVPFAYKSWYQHKNRRKDSVSRGHTERVD